jgi:hypothetical protein
MARDVHQQSGQMARDSRPVRHHPPAPGVEVVHSADRPIVRVIGRVDRAKTIEVSGAVRGLLAVGVSDLVVDLSDSWDGAGLLPTLARVRAVLTERGGTLHLVGVALPEFLVALGTAPLDQTFLIYDAIRRIRADAPGAPLETVVMAERNEADGIVDQIGA